MKPIVEFLRFCQSWNRSASINNKEIKTNYYLFAGVILFLVFILSLTKFSAYFLPVMALLSVAAGSIIFSLAGIKNSFHLLLFSFPLSLNLPVNGDTHMMIPSELLVSSFALSIIFTWIRETDKFIIFLKSSVTIAILFYLLFAAFSVLTSEMLMVSAKALTVKIIFVIAFYGGGFIYFSKVNTKATFLKYYLFPLLLVIGYVLIRHADFSFSKDASGFVTRPFFQDHTIYSAVLAFLLPLTGILIFRSHSISKAGYFLSFLVILVAIVFASSRAAWLSLIVSSVFYLLISFRIPVKAFAVFLLILPILVYFNADSLAWKLKSNRYDSGARNASLEDQTRSVTNITNDQSNAERINRWKCAVRMFVEKPFTGFGPGTYQFVYFPFQRENEMTRISVKSPYNIAEGRGGTAHNEFLLVLSESGMFAATAFMIAVLITIFTGLKLYYGTTGNYFDIAMLLAFITFITHSLFNNFLDTDKAAVLFFIAMAYVASRFREMKSSFSYER